MPEGDNSARNSVMTSFSQEAHPAKNQVIPVGHHSGKPVPSCSQLQITLREGGLGDVAVDLSISYEGAFHRIATVTVFDVTPPIESTIGT